MLMNIINKYLSYHINVRLNKDSEKFGSNRISGIVWQGWKLNITKTTY